MIGFLLRLDNPELIEHVLVVKNCVRKLILEVLLVEQFLDPLVDHWVFKNLVDVRPLVGILVEHGLKEVVDRSAEVAWYVWIFARKDFLSELMERLGIKWWLKSTHLI